ncbi:hypothetical protein ANTQUA_LOCUS5300 [Anthophora quadrimaculata]
MDVGALFPLLLALGSWFFRKRAVHRPVFLEHPDHLKWARTSRTVTIRSCVDGRGWCMVVERVDGLLSAVA